MLVSRLAILNTVFFLPCWGGNDVGDVDIEAEIEVELMDLMSFWRRKGLGVVLSLALRLASSGLVMPSLSTLLPLSLLLQLRDFSPSLPSIPCSAQEQWVTLEIPSEFPRRWIEAGYSHIHFGAIRLSLNYHGVEGKPVVARISLLDTKYLKYEDACIATVEVTMNNGLIMVTLFPNFTMALADPNLMEALKVQIHIVGAPQVADSIIATLHYQFAYRI
ncbi:hypothetical protein V6N12_036204 [Hibiscus sabdariffa]|uniref:Uncharacterized protein n=1 Tax=Hibiscus sabdariffa TaxID=183260 RepID=A0ABR2EPZ8_9ROSI